MPPGPTILGKITSTGGVGSVTYSVNTPNFPFKVNEKNGDFNLENELNYEVHSVGIALYF